MAALEELFAPKNLDKRGALLPIGKDGGEIVAAYPQFLLDLVDTIKMPGRAARGEYISPEEATRAAMDVAFMGGASGLKAAPRGSLAMGASKKALPMDKASRMARAREMGFDVDNPVYHGTNADFKAFDSSKIGQRATAEGYGHYLATDKNVARGYTSRGEQGVMDLFHKVKNPIDSKSPTFNQKQTEKILRQLLDDEIAKYADEVVDYKDSYLSNFVDTYSISKDNAIKNTAKLLRDNESAVDLVSELANVFGSKEAVARAIKKATGHDGIIARKFGQGGDVVVAWFPEDIRSVNAAFDPAKANSADLLAINPASATAFGLVPREQYKGDKPKGKYGEDFI